ncbi:hypothetical protein L0U85_12430, partial [Glycomyces sp. L485]|uniref:hypothetical protein n=1 Tax=Glycomyces sp. L485 TaxID=2909235 RepID=UPI001F4B5A36
FRLGEQAGQDDRCMTVVYDPEGMVRAQFEDPSNANLGRRLATAVGLLLIGIGVRILYIWWRVRRSSKINAGRRRGR